MIDYNGCCPTNLCWNGDLPTDSPSKTCPSYKIYDDTAGGCCARKCDDGSNPKIIATSSIQIVCPVASLYQTNVGCCQSYCAPGLLSYPEPCGPNDEFAVRAFGCCPKALCPGTLAVPAKSENFRCTTNTVTNLLPNEVCYPEDATRLPTVKRSCESGKSYFSDLDSCCPIYCQNRDYPPVQPTNGACAIRQAYEPEGQACCLRCADGSLPVKNSGGFCPNYFIAHPDNNNFCCQVTVVGPQCPYAGWATTNLAVPGCSPTTVYNAAINSCCPRVCPGTGFAPTDFYELWVQELNGRCPYCIDNNRWPTKGDCGWPCMICETTTTAGGSATYCCG